MLELFVQQTNLFDTGFTTSVVLVGFVEHSDSNVEGFACFVNLAPGGGFEPPTN